MKRINNGIGQIFILQALKHGIVQQWSNVPRSLRENFRQVK